MATRTRSLSPGVPYEEIVRARSVVSDLARPTQMLESLRLSELLGGRIALKAENLQRTGSFKLRGALNKIASLEPGIRGVVTGSAGNHGQSLAFAARARGLGATVFMPERASLGKIAAAQESGAEVIVGGESVHACISAAEARAEAAADLAFVHPYNDPLIVAGQGTLGLEIAEDVDDLARVLVPVGGGGLAAGVATAIKETRPDVELIGVQAEVCAPLRDSIAKGQPVGVPGGVTLADGIAVKRPGPLTFPILSRLLDGVAAVDEDSIAEAIVLLLERAKLVVEGAGAVGIAALMSGAASASKDGTTVVILSGGNIDPGVLADVTRRHETATGRRLRLFTTIADEPGSLAALLTCLGDAGANLIDVMHVREGVGLGVGETGVELVMETRGTEHAQELLRLLEESGYAVRVLS
jgi:threonine dehydratase